MRLEELEYHAPASLAEASVLLKRLGAQARIVAGGTDVLADMKMERLSASHLVSLADIEELKRIEPKKDGLWIGAMVTPNRLKDSETVLEACTGLADAAASMAGTQIRNLATIGGNICGAVPSADLIPSLLTMEAQVLLATHDGERYLPLREFLVDYRKTAIRPAEILAAVFIPALPEGTGTAYVKFQLRGASALAVVGAAARLTLKGGTIEKALVAVGAAAPTSILIDEAEAFLREKKPLEEHFARAGEMASKGVKPITDLRGSEAYRRDLARALTVRALKKAHERIRS